MRAFVSEHGTVDAGLTAGVDELSPNKQGVCCAGSQDDLFAWSAEQLSLSPVLVLVCRIMPFIHFQAGSVAIFGEPPDWFHPANRPLFSFHIFNLLDFYLLSFYLQNKSERKKK